MPEKEIIIVDDCSRDGTRDLLHKLGAKKFSQWVLKQKRLLNSQTGKVEAVNITALGEDKITVRGAPVTAQRYRISAGKHSIELWYGTDNAWLALVSTLDGGRKLRYLLK